MKPRQVVGQRRSGPPHSQLKASDLGDSQAHAARHGVGPNALLTMAEAAIYLRYHHEGCTPATCRCADVCRQFLQRQGADLSRRGRVYLVRQRELDLLLDLAPGETLIDRKARRRTGLSVARG